MRRVAGIGVVAALLGCNEADRADTCNAVDAPAVETVELDREPQCLGIRVAPGWFLTAQHCVQPLGEPPFAPARLTVAGASVVTVALRLDPVESLGALTGADLALLRIASDDGPVVAVGSPSALPTCAVVRRRMAPVAAPTRVVADTTVYTEPLTQPGDSGGPLLDLDGAAIGIASWRGASNGPAVYSRIDAHEDWLWSNLDE